MIELVFVIVILGVLAAVAVPRFAATRTDAQIATARSDIATALNAIPAKALADNIDATMSTPTNPDSAWGKGSPLDGWGEWIFLVAGFDSSRWGYNGRGNQITGGAIAVQSKDAVAPLGTKGGEKKACGGVLGISTNNGELVFTPQSLKNSNSFNDKDFCGILQNSYAVSGAGSGNRIIPLMSSNTLTY